MKKLHYAIITILSTCVILGCIPLGAAVTQGAASDETPQTAENVIPEETTEALPENGAQENEISEEFASTVIPKVNVKVMDWDGEKLENIFFEGRTDFDYIEHPCDFFSEDRFRLYEDETYWFGYEPGRFEVEERSNTYGQRTMQYSIRLYRFEEYLTEDSIDGLSKEDAIRECTDILEKAGITNYAEPRVYAMSAEKANKYWFDIEDYMDWDWERWSADEECYYIFFPIEYNGIPVNDASPDTGGILFSDSYAAFIVTKDRIISVDANGIFSPEYELGEDITVNIGADEAMKIAAKHLAGIDLPSTEFVVTGCELVYVPMEQLSDKEFALEPMWRINVSEKRDELVMGVRNYLHIDVQTGNVVYGRT